MAKKKNGGIPAPSAEYQIGEWAGSPHYQCQLCQFDTLSGLDTMLTHLVERHSSEVALNALFPGAPNKLPEGAPVNGAEIKETSDGTNKSE